MRNLTVRTNRGQIRKKRGVCGTEINTIIILNNH